MKKLIILVALVAIFAVGASADDMTMGKGLTAKGVKFGINMAKFTGSDIDAFISDISDELGTQVDNKMYMAFGGGAFLEYSFSPQFAIQPEVMYMMKGTKIEAAGEEAKFKMGYIEIPVLLKFKIPTEGNFKPNIFAGPAVDFLMSADLSNSISIDVKDAFKDIDFGVAFGAGFMYAMNTGGIIFDARYTLGLSKIPDVPDGFESISIKNSNISFMVGYSF